jgi:hypothetical protein
LFVKNRGVRLPHIEDIDLMAWHFRDIARFRVPCCELATSSLSASMCAITGFASRFCYFVAELGKAIISLVVVARPRAVSSHADLKTHEASIGTAGI